MLLRCLTALFLGLALATLLPPSPRAADEPVAALMMRFPDVSATQIAFEYANDIWLVPRSGGMAVPLSSPAGVELFPRFSADGQTIAFSANYDGSLNVYTLPVTGGIPHRLTFEAGGQYVQDWSPDGRVVFSSGEQTPYKGARLFYASLAGGIPEALPLFTAASCSFSADGKRLAYMPWSAEDRTWNRYQGGLAPDIWIYDFDKQTSTQVTDFPGTDAIPMFLGNQLYYISDDGLEHRRNIWVYDPASGSHTQVTHFADFEVKYPSAGPDCIILENGGKLYLLSVPGHELSEVKVQLPGDRRQLRPQTVDVSQTIFEGGISPTGKRVVVNARGDVWTLPAEHGYARNLTRTDGVAERSPAWSPDGKSIAYFCDESGEYELCVRPADGSGAAKQLTHDLKAFLFSPVWSPDSKHIAFNDKAANLYVCDVATGATQQIDRDPWDPGLGGMDMSWSPDSNWLAYAISDEANANQLLKVYNLQERKATVLTSAMFNSASPVFDKSGDYLYFYTARHFSPQFSEVDDSEEFLFTHSVYPAVLPLRQDVKSPFAPTNDEEKGPGADKAEGQEPGQDGAGAAAGGKTPPADAPADASAGAAGKDAAKPDASEPPKEVKIDLAGIEQRTIALPLPAGGYRGLAAGAGVLYYLRGGDGDNASSPTLFAYDLQAKAERPVREAVEFFELSADGSALLTGSNNQVFIVPTDPNQPPPAAPVSTAGMLTEINPRSEWREVVRDAWRIYRDYFYDPNMHGVNWPAIRDRSLKLVDSAATREDVNYIISEMISELNTSHTYVGAPPSEEAAPGNTGVLGCDFAQAKDSTGHAGIQFAKIYRGADWEPEVQGPLSQPGNTVHEGEFLLAVNGTPVQLGHSPNELLQGKAGQPTKLTVGPTAAKDGKERDVMVTPQAEDSELRLRAWIEANRQYVADKTGGRVGYIYVRDTFVPGLTDLERQFNGQFMKDGLIIDERWNGGGFLPHRFIEVLNRPVRNYWARRDGKSWRTPFHAHNGPKAMLINEHAGSGGDAFPYYFRQSGLGKLIGTRTWGGLVGLSGNPGLLDGSGITVPTFGIYRANGTWVIEGHGVDPDIQVINDQADLARGVDKQLDAGIAEVMAELAANPPAYTQKPAYPDRSGAGIRPEDQ